mgnify:CR=1 FL=1
MNDSQYLKNYEKTICESIKAQLSSTNEAIALLVNQLSNFDVQETITSINNSIRDAVSHLPDVRVDFPRLRDQIMATQRTIADFYYNAFHEYPPISPADPPQSIEDAELVISETKSIIKTDTSTSSDKLTKGEKFALLIALLGLLFDVITWAVNEASDKADNGGNQTIINNYYAVALDASALLDEISEQIEINSDDAS